MLSYVRRQNIRAVHKHVSCHPDMTEMLKTAQRQQSVSLINNIICPKGI